MRLCGLSPRIHIIGHHEPYACPDGPKNYRSDGKKMASSSFIAKVFGCGIPQTVQALTGHDEGFMLWMSHIQHTPHLSLSHLHFKIFTSNQFVIWGPISSSFRVIQLAVHAFFRSDLYYNSSIFLKLQVILSVTFTLCNMWINRLGQIINFLGEIIQLTHISDLYTQVACLLL